MRSMRVPRSAALGLLALALLPACGGSGGDGSAPSGPSGSLGVVTQPAADRAVSALCTMLTTSQDRERLTALFEDQAHQELHVIAAATQERDRTAAGAMLLAKERVEADLAQRELPASMHDDTVALMRRTQDALVAIGLDAPACGADEGYSPGSA